MAWLTMDSVEFFRELADNNNREWFEANKKRFENSVKQPLEALSAVLLPEMQRLDPAINLDPRKALFRIYRDTRFSEDKTPYKTNAGLSISSKKNDFSRPGLYFHLDGDGMAVATGCYVLETIQIQAVRAFIAGHLDDFQAITSSPEFVSAFGEVKGEKGKKISSDLMGLAEREPLLYNRSFYVWSAHSPETVLRNDLPDFIMKLIRTAWPFNEFLARALVSASSSGL